MLIVLASQRIHTFLRQQLRLHQLGMEAGSWLFQLRHPFIEQGEGRSHPLLPMTQGNLFGQTGLPVPTCTTYLGGLQPAAALG